MAPRSATYRRKIPAMLAVLYAALLPICSFTLAIFGFFVGRCARKIPILYDNLPRALHRGEVSRAVRQATIKPAEFTIDGRD